MSMINIHRPRQESAGSVALNTTDPRDPPVINFDWLTGKNGAHDIQALTEAAEMLQRSFDAAPEP